MGDGDAAAGGDERLRLDRFVAVAGVQDRRLAALSKRTEPWERASLLGFNDLLNGATGAGLTLLGGVALTAGGVAALAIGAVVLVTIPALWILVADRGATPRSSESNHLGRRPCTPNSP